MRVLAIVLPLFLVSACATHSSVPQALTPTFQTFRLKPGDDLQKSIQARVDQGGIKAASIVTVVGSLTQASIRFANQPNTTVIKRDLEIVSVTGTLSTNGSHLHLAVSGPKGETWGGHLMEGSWVRTTAEITIVEFHDVEFVRELDPASGYRELVVKTRP